MKAFHLSPKGVEPKGGMAGVDFKKSEGLLVLAHQIRVPLEELGRPFRVAFREDQTIAHRLFA